jgi:hypothetical protein
MENPACASVKNRKLLKMFGIKMFGINAEIATASANGRISAA